MKNPFTLHIKNRTVNFDHIRDLKLRRRRVLDELDRTHFQWLVVFVSGVGFLADGYDIYAASLIMPMISHVYWENNMPAQVEAALNAAILAGTVIGQLAFGIFADVYGRKTMYGLELMIIIGSTVGITMSSEGAGGSMNMLGWLISWRVLLGVGIGGDYPLSAVITSEFAPTKSRGRMLATVFFMQPIGYLLATIVSVIVLAAYGSDIRGHATCQDNIQCRSAVDSVWRWVIGLGTIPAALAIFLRFSIPESPRYTTEILNRPGDALEDVNQMDLPAMSPTPAPAPDMEANAEFEIYGSGVPGFNATTLHRNEGSLDEYHASDNVERRSLASPHGSPMLRGASSTTVNEGLHHNITDPNLLTATAGARTSFGNNGVVFTRPFTANDERPASLALSPTMLTHAESHESGPSSEEDGGGIESRNIWANYRSVMKEYLWDKGCWVVLFGTSLTWFFFDFAFYVMGPNSTHVSDRVFNTLNDEPDVYLSLMRQLWHSLVIVSLGSILGGISMIYLIGRFSPRTLQLAGFLLVFALFLVVGLVFIFLPPPAQTPLVVFLYVIAMVFFQIGPNFTTYIIPSELFPTQFRCTGVGISAAAGKTAAVFAQLFSTLSSLAPQRDGSSKWFGVAIIVFGVFMLIGAALTKWLTPETRTADGQPKPLEELEYVGRKYPIRYLSMSKGEKENIPMGETNIEDSRIMPEPTTDAATHVQGHRHIVTDMEE
ncbi:major facilitator superfamily domain-containing protein [Talaromyces proteolyticus]|uniref:Major facilitator superfamily domain-containing protein n=1 Tax=Talaromyces proteolyticus TaxID=1131652 RepID=A0AAD4KYY8_9EURO|nr:major facilitator superfamily domain-containing protein [Talaromyces proteolyticus]KAH8699096.1 major facilitator superfamily domain-containing protein [Talaromyces proteolyticus]